MDSLARLVIATVAAIVPLEALTLPSQGYMIIPRADGGLYRRMLNETQKVKIINAGKSPSINPKDGGIIAYVESGNKVILTDPDGLSRRVVPGTYGGMGYLNWTDQGDRFTFTYSGGWGIMDTLGNFKNIPKPYSAAIEPMMSGNTFFFNEDKIWDCRVATIDPSHPENGVVSGSIINVDGCYGTLAPGGVALAHHDGGHTGVDIQSITRNANGSISVGSVFSVFIHCCAMRGIKWSNDYRWLVLRDEDDGHWYIVHLPAYGSTVLENSYYMDFESSDFSGPNGYVLPVFWVGPFGRANMVGAPGISSATTSVTDSMVITITPADAQSSVYYTLNNTDPTNLSTPYTKPFGIRMTTDSLVVKARAYKTGVDASSVTRYVVYRLKLRDPDTASVSPGLSYKYYTTGSLSSLPDFASLAPAKTGIVDSFTLSVAAQATNFAILYEGYISAPADGLYAFSLTSDDGSRLWIGNTLIVDNDGGHGAQERGGTIGLKAGLHAIRVGFFQGTGGDSLRVAWAPVSATLKAIGKSECFHYDSLATPHITVTSPAAGAIFHLGDTMLIRWTYSPGYSVRIMCSNNNGRSFPFDVPPVLCGADGSGSYAWPLAKTDTAMVGTQCKVAVVDYMYSNIRGQSDVFTISRPGATAGNRASLPIAGGDFIIRGNSITFGKAPCGPYPLVTITSMNGRSYFQHATSGESFARWDLGSLAPGIYMIEIRSQERTITRRIAVDR